MTGPICDTCNNVLPSLETLKVPLGEEETENCEVVAFTVHVRCKCGEAWALKQDAGDDDGDETGEAWS